GYAAGRGPASTSGRPCRGQTGVSPRSAGTGCPMVRPSPKAAQSILSHRHWRASRDARSGLGVARIRRYREIRTRASEVDPRPANTATGSGTLGPAARGAPPSGVAAGASGPAAAPATASSAPAAGLACAWSPDRPPEPAADSGSPDSGSPDSGSVVAGSAASGPADPGPVVAGRADGDSATSGSADFPSAGSGSRVFASADFGSADFASADFASAGSGSRVFASADFASADFESAACATPFAGTPRGLTAARPTARVPPAAGEAGSR